MNDRASFLKAIRAKPDDDTLRLVFADWLDEKGDRGDLDTATAEFIRLSCANKPSREIRPAAAEWLLGSRVPGVVTRPDNWKRLIPSVLTIDRENRSELMGNGWPYGFRSGRRVSTSFWLPAPVRTSRAYAAEFEFHRGFLVRARLTSVQAANELLEALHRDQPLVQLDFRSLSGPALLKLLDRVEALVGRDGVKWILAKAG